MHFMHTNTTSTSNYTVLINTHSLAFLISIQLSQELIFRISARSVHSYNLQQPGLKSYLTHFPHQPPPSRTTQGLVRDTGMIGFGTKRLSDSELGLKGSGSLKGLDHLRLNINELSDITGYTVHPTQILRLNGL